ncbi:TPM domain-containing protein [Parasutterella excrementihominis]|uniref:TPM domain-containing protein n=1 Tax=Parasutterella excrementihominis TaxID=487175 RepID=UPI00266F5809|nr:TPM domain-containing protein [Parasutterella excrementihominis]
MSIGRILKHWVMSPVPVTLAFPQSSLDAVTKCIEECEQQTSAEFRLIIERSIPSKGLRENISDAQRAKELFGRYGVWDTEDNNGVLIYLNLSDRAIEIYLDRGAAREVRQTQLDDIVKQMEIAFADKKFEEGVCQAFRSLAAILSKPFPNKPVQDPVPNTPVVL